MNQVQCTPLNSKSVNSKILIIKNFHQVLARGLLYPDLLINQTSDTSKVFDGNGYRKATDQIPADDDIIYLDSMTLPDQSQTEVRRLTTSLTKPKVNVNIGCWNVRTLYSIGKSAQLTREMDKYK